MPVVERNTVRLRTLLVLKLFRRDRLFTDVAALPGARPAVTIWKALSVSALSPSLYSAVERRETLSFHLLHKKDQARIQNKRFCSEENVESREGLRIRERPVRRRNGRELRKGARARYADV
jgi:hypothetical protein